MLTTSAESSVEELDQSSTEVVEGFVQNLTQIKSGRNSKFFNAILQVSQKDYINMICFSTEMHELLITMSKNKSALKFSGISFLDTRLGSGGKDVTVYKTSKINKTTVKFYTTRPFWSFLANFCSLQAAECRVTEGDHIHIAITVQSCNNITERATVRGSEIARKDYVVTDKSGSITLSTWGEYTDILQIGKTYMIGNVTVKSLHGIKCLNTNIRTSIIEGVWDRRKHELDYTTVFPSIYPEGGGMSLEDQKRGNIKGGASGPPARPLHPSSPYVAPHHRHEAPPPHRHDAPPHRRDAPPPHRREAPPPSSRMYGGDARMQERDRYGGPPAPRSRPPLIGETPMGARPMEPPPVPVRFNSVFNFYVK